MDLLLTHPHTPLRPATTPLILINDKHFPHSGNGRNNMSGMASPLEGAAVNLNALRDDHSLAFTELLDSVPGSKLLVMDFQLSNVLNNVFTQGPKILKEHGVIDLLELNWGSGKVEQEKYRDASVVYVIRPSVTRAKQIAEHVSAVSLLSPCTDATPSGCDETVCLGGIPLAGGSVAGYASLGKG